MYTNISDCSPGSALSGGFLLDQIHHHLSVATRLRSHLLDGLTLWIAGCSIARWLWTYPLLVIAYQQEDAKDRLVDVLNRMLPLVFMARDRNLPDWKLPPLVEPKSQVGVIVRYSPDFRAWDENCHPCPNLLEIPDTTIFGCAFPNIVLAMGETPWIYGAGALVCDLTDPEAMNSAQPPVPILGPEELGALLTEWAQAHAEKILRCRPAVSERISKDVWADVVRPLHAVADIAGEGWSGRGRDSLSYRPMSEYWSDHYPELAYRRVEKIVP